MWGKRQEEEEVQASQALKMKREEEPNMLRNFLLCFFSLSRTFSCGSEMRMSSAGSSRGRPPSSCVFSKQENRKKTFNPSQTLLRSQGVSRTNNQHEVNESPCLRHDKTSPEPTDSPGTVNAYLPHAHASTVHEIIPMRLCVFCGGKKETR